MKSFYEACEQGNLEEVKKLSYSQIEENDNNAIILASRYTRFEILKFLVENGADVQTRNNEVIINAIRNNYFKMVEYLLFKGADPNAQNGEPLIWASQFGYFDIIKLLVEKGADPTIRNGEAVLYCREFKIIQYLVKKGCNWKKINIFDKIKLKTVQLQQLHYRNNFRNICINLLPVYYSPNFIGGKLAKKDLRNFITRLKTP